jgi:hypothetical protein
MKVLKMVSDEDLSLLRLGSSLNAFLPSTELQLLRTILRSYGRMYIEI